MRQRSSINGIMILAKAVMACSITKKTVRRPWPQIAMIIGTLMLGMITESLSQSPDNILTMQAPHVAAHARYGWRVDTHDDWAVISSPFEGVDEDIAAGRVYIHSAKKRWQQVQIIEAPDAQTVQTFGMSLALTGDLLAVGAPGDHEGGLMSGAVYLYTRNADTWKFSAKVLSPEPNMGGQFGCSVDLSANVLVVGARRSFGSAEKSGSVYLFRRDSTAWRYVRELYPEMIQPDESFGTSIRLIDDSTVAVARTMSDPFGGRIEAVTIFSRRGGKWVQQGLLVPGGGGADLFGAAMASNDRYIAVGIPGWTIGNKRCGSVVLYDRSTLQPLHMINNPKMSELIYFGGSISLTGNRLYISCVQTGDKERKPMGMVAGYEIPTFDSASTKWYSLEDQESLPHACPQVSATDSVVLASSPFGDVDGMVDAGMVRFFPLSGLVNVEGPPLPLEYSLAQNYPNPFNAMTRINFSLKAPGKVRIDLFNILGQRVETLENKEMKEGRYSIAFDARHLASGVYFYRIIVNEFVALKKMVLLK